MIAEAIERIEQGAAMAGLAVVKRLALLSTLIDDIILISECTESQEWRDRIEFLPL